MGWQLSGIALLKSSEKRGRIGGNDTVESVSVVGVEGDAA